MKRRMKEVTSTQQCFCFMLILAQCFGMIPVCGITSDAAKSLEFSWKSKRTIYSCLYALAAAVNSIFQVVFICHFIPIDFGKLVTLLFYLVTIFTVVVFIDVARKWPKLMKIWSEVDGTLFKYGFPVGLHKKLKIVAVIVMFGAIVEHSLFISYVLRNIDFASANAKSLAEKFNFYCQQNFKHVFSAVPYSIFLGISVQILNTFSTISWNFMDLFIMLVSLALATRFTQVINKVKLLAKKRVESEVVWRNLRENYNQLCVLCRALDDCISNIMLVSFANNIFVIVVQIFYTLQRGPTNHLLDKTYYAYSFLFLIGRTVAVSLFAATIHTESGKLVSILNSLSNYVYNVEIERFLIQIKYETPSLTGHNLFQVSRAIIFTVARTIVAYELIIIQLNIEINNF